MINFNEMIQKRLDKADEKQRELLGIVLAMMDTLTWGLEADGVKHRGLDEEMWNYIDAMLVRLSEFLSISYGANSEKPPDVNVLPRYYPELSKVVKVQGERSTVTRQVSQFRKAEERAEEAGGKGGKGGSQESEPVQTIQTQGQPLPNVYALRLGTAGDKWSYTQLYINECQSLFYSYYLQASFGGDVAKRLALEKVKEGLRELVVLLLGFHSAGFQTIDQRAMASAERLARIQAEQPLIYSSRRGGIWPLRRGEDQWEYYDKQAERRAREASSEEREVAE